MEEPRTKNQEPRTENQEPRTENQASSFAPSPSGHPLCVRNTSCCPPTTASRHPAEPEERKQAADQQREHADASQQRGNLSRLGLRHELQVKVLVDRFEVGLALRIVVLAAGQLRDPLQGRLVQPRKDGEAVDLERR